MGRVALRAECSPAGGAVAQASIGDVGLLASGRCKFDEALVRYDTDDLALAPVPSAMVTAAVIVNTGVLRKVRSA